MTQVEQEVKVIPEVLQAIEEFMEKEFGKKKEKEEDYDVSF